MLKTNYRFIVHLIRERGVEAPAAYPAGALPGDPPLRLVGGGPESGPPRERGIAREDEETAWRVAHAPLPEDRKGQLAHQLAMKKSDSSVAKVAVTLC